MGDEEKKGSHTALKFIEALTGIGDKNREKHKRTQGKFVTRAHKRAREDETSN